MACLGCRCTAWQPSAQSALRCGGRSEPASGVECGLRRCRLLRCGRLGSPSGQLWRQQAWAAAAGSPNSGAAAGSAAAGGHMARRSNIVAAAVSTSQRQPRCKPAQPSSMPLRQPRARATWRGMVASPCRASPLSRPLLWAQCFLSAGDKQLAIFFHLPKQARPLAAALGPLVTLFVHSVQCCCAGRRLAPGLLSFPGVARWRHSPAVGPRVRRCARLPRPTNRPNCPPHLPTLQLAAEKGVTLKEWSAAVLKPVEGHQVRPARCCLVDPRAACTPGRCRPMPAAARSQRLVSVPIPTANQPPHPRCAALPNPNRPAWLRQPPAARWLRRARSS